MERVNRHFGRGFQWDSYSQGVRQLGLGFFERDNVTDRELRSGSFVNANSSPDEHWGYDLQALLQALQCFGEYEHLH